MADKLLNHLLISTNINSKFSADPFEGSPLETEKIVNSGRIILCTDSPGRKLI